jgi:outer membrane murein-binding lipoprotein Lpp
MNKYICIALLGSSLLAGCASPGPGKSECDSELSTAWKELDMAKAEGMAGGVSYSQALVFLSAAKADQSMSSYGGCSDSAKKARFYIRESRAGR